MIFSDNSSQEINQKRSTRLFPFLIFLLLLACYVPSFNAGWHFDDIGNILLNTPLHLQDLSWHSVSNTFFAYPDQAGKLLRPVTNLTFGFNWFFGENNVFGYHLVNFLIHFFTTIILFKTCLLLLATPNINNRYSTNCYLIAGLATIFWAANPVQTQAVTYIVQRMASLATMFYILGLYFYLKARLTNKSDYQQYTYLTITFVCFLLAIGSKENSIIFPASVALIEIIFFQKTLLTKKTLLTVVLVVFFTIFFTIILVGNNFMSGILTSYETRNFSLFERLITESRVVTFYLGLLFYPAPWRLSITHDFTLSASLFQPATTLPSISILVLLTALSIIYYKRFPFFSFAMLFFLANHIVESTIIPLELVFEHRNYLPSLFLFLPISIGIAELINRYKKDNKLLYILISGVTSIVIISFCIGTFSRNKTWKTEETLWSDALSKAPRTARPYINLGHWYLYNKNDYLTAYTLFQNSLTKNAPTPWKSQLPAYFNMGYIMNRIGKYEQAGKFFELADKVSQAGPDNQSTIGVTTEKARSFLLAEQPEKAIELLKNTSFTVSDHVSPLQSYAEALVLNNQYQESITAFSRLLRIAKKTDSNYQGALLGLSLVYARLNQYEKSAFFLDFAQKLSRNFLQINLCRLENSIRQTNIIVANQTVKTLLTELTWPDLMKMLSSKSPTSPPLPLDKKLIRTYILDFYLKTSNYDTKENK